MSNSEIRSEIEEMLNQLDDRFLKAIHVMLKTYVKEKPVDPIIGYDVDGQPCTC